MPKARPKEEASSSKPPPRELPKMPLWVPYRYGATNIDPQNWDDRPRALLLFSGRPRDGDIASYLHKDGWIVVVADKIGPEETDLLDPKVAKAILSDIKAGVFDALGVATPCETLSPLRENPPGPRPLRSLASPDGLPEQDLTTSERTQLTEGNDLIKLSKEAILEQLKIDRPFWLENPNHGKDKVDLWKTSWILNLCGSHTGLRMWDFDQCRLGAEVTKPTRILCYDTDLEGIAGLRCNHPPKEWKRPNGSKYKAAHESLVQRWRKNEEGKTERASKKLGEYPPALSEVLAEAMEGVETQRARDHVQKQMPKEDQI